MSDPLFARFGHRYQAGEVLFRERDPGDVMYVIQAGAVRISKEIGGHVRQLAVLGPGEFLGEMAILNGKPRTATATVVEDARCLVIDAKTLEQMVAKNSEIALRLIKKLAKRLDSADTLIEILMHRDPKARLLLAMSRHAEAFGEPHPEGILVRTSAEEIAREVGVEQTVAADVGQRLQRMRLVKAVADGIIVADVTRLHDFVELLEMPQKFGEA
jgi:CRP-like cAMP-binding protein